MKKWQKDRNYKRVKDKDGNVVANIITVSGQDVEVSEKVLRHIRRWTGRSGMRKNCLWQNVKFRGNTQGKKVYISKRWKTQNRAQRKSVSNMKM